MRSERGEERVGDSRHNHTDGVGAIAVQIAGQLVGNIVELAHRGLDFGAHIVRDIAGVIDHQRNGAERHSCRFGYVAHTDHGLLPREY